MSFLCGFVSDMQRLAEIWQYLPSERSAILEYWSVTVTVSQSFSCIWNLPGLYCKRLFSSYFYPNSGCIRNHKGEWASKIFMALLAADQGWPTRQLEVREKGIRPSFALSSDPTTGGKLILTVSSICNPPVWLSEREAVILKVARVAQTRTPQWLFTLELFTHLNFYMLLQQEVLNSPTPDVKTGFRRRQWYSVNTEDWNYLG